MQTPGGAGDIPWDRRGRRVKKETGRKEDRSGFPVSDMKKKLKQLLSVCVSLCLFAALCAPAFAELEGDYNTAIPTVYLQGQGNIIYADKNDRSSEKLQTVDLPDGYIGDEAKKLIRPLAKGLLTDDWSDWVDQFMASAAPLFEKQALDVNGEASDGSGNNEMTRSVADKANADGTYQIGAYMPAYDWRLDPCALADELHGYIENVKRKTGAEKVNLMGRSIGASVLLAYLAEYGAADLDTVILYCPSFFGMEVISKAFAGKIEISPEAAGEFARYFVDSGMAADTLGEENMETYRLLADFISTMVSLHALDLPAAALERVYGKIYTELYPRLLVKMYGSMPSFWSLVGDDDYEQAKRNVFSGQEDTYAGLIEKIDNYHNNVMNQTAEILQRLVAEGAKIQIVCKYGVPMIPAVEGARAESDMLTSVYSASYGATCADSGSTLSAAYLAQANADGNARYISPDNKIDAASCLLPEHTWFIRDVAHRSMPEGVNELLAAILNYDGYMTVFDDADYPQYMAYDAETDSVSPVRPAVPAPTGIRAFFAKLKDFFSRFFSLIKRLLAR